MPSILHLLSAPSVGQQTSQSLGQPGYPTFQEYEEYGAPKQRSIKVIPVVPMANVLKEAFVALMETTKATNVREKCILVVVGWTCFSQSLIEMGA